MLNYFIYLKNFTMNKVNVPLELPTSIKDVNRYENLLMTQEFCEIIALLTKQEEEVDNRLTSKQIKVLLNERKEAREWKNNNAPGWISAPNYIWDKVNQIVTWDYNDTNSPYCQTPHWSDNCVVIWDTTFMQNSRWEMIACARV